LHIYSGVIDDLERYTKTVLGAGTFLTYLGLGVGLSVDERRAIVDRGYPELGLSFVFIVEGGVGE
jgi:hypothetical protein